MLLANKWLLFLKQFLASCNIMDYSLLVGIHNVHNHLEQHAILARETSPQKPEDELSAVLTDGSQDQQQQQQLDNYDEDAIISEDTYYGPTSQQQQEQLQQQKQAQQSAFQKSALCSPIVSGNKEHVYFIGIIDILQEYNFSKRLERGFKHYILGNDKLGVSSQPPDFYALRFQSKLGGMMK